MGALWAPSAAASAGRMALLWAATKVVCSVAPSTWAALTIPFDSLPPQPPPVTRCHQLAIRTRVVSVFVPIRPLPTPTVVVVPPLFFVTSSQRLRKLPRSFLFLFLFEDWSVDCCSVYSFLLRRSLCRKKCPIATPGEAARAADRTKKVSPHAHICLVTITNDQFCRCRVPLHNHASVGRFALLPSLPSKTTAALHNRADNNRRREASGKLFFPPPAVDYCQLFPLEVRKRRHGSELRIGAR